MVPLLTHNKYQLGLSWSYSPTTWGGNRTRMDLVKHGFLTITRDSRKRDVLGSVGRRRVRRE